MTVATIQPAALAQKRALGASIDLIDVRTPAEFQEAHVEFARNLPLEQLDPQTLVGHPGGEPLYVICRSGMRGQKACEKLRAAGITNVLNVEGGTLACEVAGLPIVRGKKAVSLERQVRIAAGSVVLLGSLLGYFAHPYWMGLAAFIGAGLVFSGITDTCGMAMVLARMPWNQVRDGSQAQSGACCSR